MKCEICDEQTATMWVEPPEGKRWRAIGDIGQPRLSCDDCGPQLGYKTLASLTSVQCHG